jgi:hypothetical protein
MTAQFITYLGETVALVLARPNLKTEPKITPNFLSDLHEHPISKFSSARNYARTVRYDMQYRARLPSVAEATEFRIWLNQQKAQTIALPLWTDVCYLTAAKNAGATSLPIDQHPVRSGSAWIVLAPDNSTYEIVTASNVTNSTLTVSALTLNWPKGTTVYPLIFGRLEEAPDLELITPSKHECDLKFKESSVFAKRVNPYTSTVTLAGAQVPNLAALPLWTLQPSYDELSDTVEAHVVWNDPVGKGRVAASVTYSTTPNARTLTMKFACQSRDEIAQAENFFSYVKGQAGKFLIASPRNDLELAADVSSGSTITIKLNEYSDATRNPFQGDPYMALVEPRNPISGDPGYIDPFQIKTVSGVNLTLETGVTVTHAHTVAKTLVAFLHLVRFAEPKIEWTYTSDYSAVATIKFIEQPSEYAALQPALKEPFFGFKFVEEQKYPRTWLFTSYEDAITLAGGQGAYAGTYAPADLSFEQLTKALDLPNQKLTLKVGAPFANNPLALFWPYQLEGKLRLYIIEGNFADLTEPVKVRFSGYVTSPKSNLTSAEVKFLTKAADLDVPRAMLMTVDNFDVFDGRPGAPDPATYKITGTIASIADTLVTVTSAAAHTLIVADPTYFNAGRLEIGTTGATFEGRAIISAVAVTGGVQLTIDRPLIKTTATGGSIDIYPGYDGSYAQLESRFGVGIIHGGFPNTPDTPPNIKAVKAETATATKK